MNGNIFRQNDLKDIYLKHAFLMIIKNIFILHKGIHRCQIIDYNSDLKSTPQRNRYVCVFSKFYDLKPTSNNMLFKFLLL